MRAIKATIYFIFFILSILGCGGNLDNLNKLQQTKYEVKSYRFDKIHQDDGYERYGYKRKKRRLVRYYSGYDSTKNHYFDFKTSTFVNHSLGDVVEIYEKREFNKQENDAIRKSYIIWLLYIIAIVVFPILFIKECSED